MIGKRDTVYALARPGRNRGCPRPRDDGAAAVWGYPYQSLQAVPPSDYPPPPRDDPHRRGSSRHL